MRAITKEVDEPTYRKWFVAERRLSTLKDICYAQVGPAYYSSYTEAYEAYVSACDYFLNSNAHENLVIIEDRSFLISEPKAPYYENIASMQAVD